MSIITQLKNQVATLEKANKTKDEKIKEMEHDIADVMTGLINAGNNLGIDVLNGGLSKLNMGSIMMLIPKIKKVDWSELEAILPRLNKYQELIK